MCAGRAGGGPADEPMRRTWLEDRKVNDWVCAGYQADAGGGKNHNGKIYEEKGRGYLSSVGETVVVRPPDEKDAAEKKQGFKKDVVKTDPEAVRVSEGIKDGE